MIYTSNRNLNCINICARGGFSLFIKKLKIESFNIVLYYTYFLNETYRFEVKLFASIDHNIHDRQRRPKCIFIQWIHYDKHVNFVLPYCPLRLFRSDNTWGTNHSHLPGKTKSPRGRQMQQIQVQLFFVVITYSA